MRYVKSMEISGKYALVITNDDDAEDIRQYQEHLGTMVTFMRNSKMGDEQPNSRGRWLADMLIIRGLNKNTDAYWDFDSDLRHDNAQATDKAFDMLEGHILYLNLYVMNHSGYRMNTEGFGQVDPGHWDWGWAGFIYVEREKALKEFHAKVMTGKVREQVYERLRSEVREYDDYLVYGVYMWTIYDISGYEAWCKTEKIRYPDEDDFARFLEQEATVVELNGHYYGDPDESGVYKEAERAFAEYKEKAQ
jgi:hypothetical protein